MLASHRFLLGGDLPSNRIGFDAMLVSTTASPGQGRDPEVGCSVRVPSSSG